MRVLVVIVVISLLVPAWAHDIVLKSETGTPLVVLRFDHEWTAVASRDAVELTSPDDRTRVHCLELRSSASTEEALVFLQTMRDTLFQTYEQTSNEPTEIDGMPALWLRGRGNSRGFDTILEALVFRTANDHYCLVMLQQDVGYESTRPDLRSMVHLP